MVAVTDKLPSASLDRGIAAGVGWLEHAQQPEGFWAGMLESNCCIEAEWLLAFHILGHEVAWQDDLVRGILDRQRPDGSWETYHEAPSGDINATVECYASLRASGLPADAEPVIRARSWIFAHGGLRSIRVFTRYWLALLGEWPWPATPNLPLEVIRQPFWSPFNIYHFASWARATLVPLAVLSARRHVCRLPADRRLDELFPAGRAAFDYGLPDRGAGWDVFFRSVDRVLHRVQSWRLTPGRPAAVARCLEWIVRRQEADGAWGGIQPPWIYSLLALHAEGYALSHPVMARGLAALEAHWSYERDGSRRIQASESPVWDTLLSVMALLDCGVRYGDSPAMQRAVGWLLGQEVRVEGDWAVKLRGVEPSGWAFERANLNYPDVDDTAVAIQILARIRAAGEKIPGLDAALGRAQRWVLAMQSRNGGWAAFDRDNDREILTRIPFCDFGETLDPPSADVTAHVLEALGFLGLDRSQPAVARGLRFLQREQEARGSWFGRWGVNHIYGTAAVLPALRAVGENMQAGYVRRAGDWLVRQQNADGGWGESCASYMDQAAIGRGSSTPSQTAWALLALLAVDSDRHAEAVRRGISFLLARQQAATWNEPHYTGTGFPGYGIGGRAELADPDLARRLQQDVELQRGFMINYNLYRHYFPLAALGRCRRASLN